MRRVMAVLYGLAAAGTQLQILSVEQTGVSVVYDWFILLPRSAALGLVWPLVWADHWLHFGGPIGTLIATR